MTSVTYRVRQKEHPDLGGAYLQVGSASSNSGVRAVFSIYHGVVGRTSSLNVEEFIKNGGSPVATQRAFRIRFVLGRREAVPDKKTIYRWVSNFRQTGQTLEALKEAVQQEVAAITPEMILKGMDNYRERLHQCINIQGCHLSDVCSKHIDVKQHSVFFPEMEKHLPYLLWF